MSSLQSLKLFVSSFIWQNWKRLHTEGSKLYTISIYSHPLLVLYSLSHKQLITFSFAKHGNFAHIVHFAFSFYVQALLFSHNYYTTLILNIMDWWMLKENQGISFLKLWVEKRPTEREACPCSGLSKVTNPSTNKKYLMCESVRYNLALISYSTWPHTQLIRWTKLVVRIIHF
jgi:hypothetical protein